ncbi:MAG TPA: sigma-70 family RNA polymerase sigma factor [Balneolaceae bacterium]|nr:sigma-70 family RNA polymerase sigma factor [Balneolaceae bacterium]
MDYSGLVNAVKNGDQLTASRLCSEATPILKRYLRKKCGADSTDADDAIQRMFEYVINKILEDDFENPRGLLSYMLKTSRHNYIKIAREKNRPDIENLASEPFHEPVQIWELIDEEKQNILKYCTEKLRKGYREFINYFFSFPNASAEDVADHFDISVNNAWTRKHRVINKLNECVETQL